MFNILDVLHLGLCRSDLQQMLLDVLLNVPLCPRQHAACQPVDGRLGFWNAGSEQ